MNFYEKEIKQFDYKNVLKYFCDISMIPRGSGYNTKISNYLRDFAAEHGIECVQDNLENIIMKKPASPGYEHVPAVIIQGHMDMVCVKDRDCSHNFEEDPLDLFLENGMLGARGTTLGGDDGIAVAYGMALLTDETLKHPAITVIITTDEETGLYGAGGLAKEHLDGGYVINCDSEVEGEVLVSCAGGLRFVGLFDFEREERKGNSITVRVSGLQGGHSGAEIHKNRSNASVLLGRVLFELKPENSALVSICGGEKDNAIPIDACAEFITSESAAEIGRRLENIKNSLTKELFASEPGLNIEMSFNEGVSRMTAPGRVSENIIAALVLTPNGIRKMSAEISGLVESSLNLGVLMMTETKCEFHYSVRSSKSSFKHFTSDGLELMFKMLGAASERHGEYPAWEYRAESKLRELYGRAFKEITGCEAGFSAIHAGLECGILSEKNPELDLISIGPDMKDIHTTRERLSVESSVRVYKTIERCLEIMA